MENKHKELINHNSSKSYHHKVTVLEIPDKYKYYQKELIDILESKINL